MRKLFNTFNILIFNKFLTLKIWSFQFFYLPLGHKNKRMEKKKVWTVTYARASFISGSVETQTKVCSTRAKALQEMADYARDIHAEVRTSQTLVDFAEECFFSDEYFQWSDGATVHTVEAEETEII